MRVAWCPAHRGVMRISFFDPPQPHFRSPCPRCHNALVEQIRNKYELNSPGAVGTEIDVPSSYPDEETICKFLDDSSKQEPVYPDEAVTPAPIPVCPCCCVAKLAHGNSLCGWCIDCPTEYCDVPTSFKKGMNKWISHS